MSYMDILNACLDYRDHLIEALFEFLPNISQDQTTASFDISYIPSSKE
jgi:hypothetical protein